ncbi:MAG: hypothetical protein IKP11_01705 [Paludibacteraceae bacterium]|nr:hypothetical protein [Paludibacteraceae bacterium]
MKAIQLTVGQVLKAKNDIWPQAPAKEYTIIQVAEEIDPQMYKEGLRGLAWAKDNETDELAALTVCEEEPENWYRDDSFFDNGYNIVYPDDIENFEIYQDEDDIWKVRML